MITDKIKETAAHKSKSNNAVIQTIITQSQITILELVRFLKLNISKSKFTQRRRFAADSSRNTKREFLGWWLPCQ